MERKILNELSSIMMDSWNQIKGYNEVKDRLKRTLGRKSISNWTKEFAAFLDTLPEEEKKNKPIYTAIFVMALLKRNLDEGEQVRKYIKKYNLVSLLYGGLSILTKGTSQKFALNITWSYNSFQNKYEFLRRFAGDFYYWEFIEFFMAAKIIYNEDKEKFRALLMEDQSKLLLLNLCSHHLTVEVSDSWLLDLMRNHQYEIHQNIGFYLLTEKLKRYIEELARLEQYKIGKKESSIQNELFKKIEVELNRINDLLLQLDEKTQTCLLFNYILSELRWPHFFSHWLLKPELQESFVKEIRYSKKVRTLKEVMKCLQIIQVRSIFPRKQCRKDELYNALVDVMTDFIRERKGIYQWTEQDEKTFEQICENLPKSSKAKLRRRLIRESKVLWTCKIDELVRFDIYLKDKATQTIIDGMLAKL
nr:hypothetical protein [Brevibacillus sp. WF146]